MKRILTVLSLIVLFGYQVAYANISADDIRELNNATPGTQKVGLGTVLSAEQANIDTNAASISTNSTSIALIDSYTGVTFLTSGDTSISSLVGIGYIRKYTFGVAEGISLGEGVAGQEITFAFAVDGGGNFEITPDTSSGFSQVTLTTAGDNVTLKYKSSTVGWVIVGLPDANKFTAPIAPFN